jgi:hypothetical protein
MALTQLEIDLCNQGFYLMGGKKVVLATQAATPEGIAANDFYVQTRDALQRFFEWPFCRTRDTLSPIYTIEFDTSPGPAAFVVGDVITGVNSEATATIITVVSDVEYEIAYLDGTFEDGETITNATVEDVVWQGIPVVMDDEQVVWYDTADSDQLVCSTGYPSLTLYAPEFGFDYQFLLPADFIRFRKNYSGSRRTIEGNRLLSNDDSGQVLYVKKITDTTLFDPLFVEILTLRLALKFVNVIAGTKSSEMLQNLKQDLQVATATARSVCGSEENDTGKSNWNNARFGDGIVYARNY